MFFKKKKANTQKEFEFKKTKIRRGKDLKTIFKNNTVYAIFLMVFVLSNNLSFASASLPFSDKIEFGLMITKVIGGSIVLGSLVTAMVFHKSGRGDAVGTASWFVVVGIVIANLDWFAEKFGVVTSGAIF
ncbi:hypothetical protein H3N56_11200 [Cetobacterium sp. 2A]|uniref:hypothetical protein n=1 Tax=Cetobacterium sp. 2A TaxID=2754723 RepID=UPI00163BC819|nr:hypothetical protein [Cetobacterium sp. 2A]MBC2856999.1 hypothetical protein [Cetobacterium sp. 2A]